MAAPLERVRGALFGVGLGDALGIPVKDVTVVRRLRFKYGHEAPKVLSYAGRPPAIFSDETQLTLFVAQGLIRHFGHGLERGEAVMDSLIAWRETQRGPGAMHPGGLLAGERRLHIRRGAETLPIVALDAVARGERPTRDHPLNQCNGPTATARSAPYGLALPTLEDAFDAAFRDAGWTHGSVDAALSAGAFAALVHGVAHGRSLADSMHDTINALGIVEGFEGPVAQGIIAAHTLASAGPVEAEGLRTLGDGKDGISALSIALACVMSLEAPNPYGFVRALWRAVAHEGCSDTTGAMAGALLGALLTHKVMPDPWLIQLDATEILDRVAHDLFAAATGGPVNARLYPRH